LDQNADTGFFEQIFKQVIPKTPAYMGKEMKKVLKFVLSLKLSIAGLNLSLKGQKIVPRVTQKREIKCERTETNKSIQSIYTLARLASSSSRFRHRPGIPSSPTIMDFMQSINFKSRLEREREMIRRKIRSSTLYRKPSFTKASSTFNLYNANNDASKVSIVTRNMKLNELKEEIKKVKSSMDEDVQDDEDKSMLCIGNKYLNTNLLSPTSIITKSVSTTTLELINNDLSMNNKNIEAADFEKAISQSHLSPSASLNNFRKSTTTSNTVEKSSEDNLQENLTSLLRSAQINSTTSNRNHQNDDPTQATEHGEEIQDFHSPSEFSKRKDHIKISKKSTQNFIYAIGINNTNGKINQINPIINNNNINNNNNGTDDENDETFSKLVHSSNHITPGTSKKLSSKKGGGTTSRKKSSLHNSHRKSGVKTSPKVTSAMIRKTDLS
jgi:hypothetical protein